METKNVTLSIKQRLLLHRLLHRELRRCSTSALDACHRFGWISGAGGGYELTAQGRLIAERSEQSPAGVELALELHPELDLTTS